jgi:hypothetical protein
MKGINGFKLLEDKILEILNGESRIVEIEKDPQIGVTTSILKVALEDNRKVCVFEPTNRILTQTIKSVEDLIDRPVTIEILQSNDKLCPYAQQDPFFDWFHCGNCKEKQCSVEVCGYKRVINKKPDILAMTYHKFAVLQFMQEAEAIPNVIFRDYDVILLDEFTRALMDIPPKISFADLKYLIDTLKGGITYRNGQPLSNFFFQADTIINARERTRSPFIRVPFDENIYKYARLFDFNIPQKYKDTLKDFIVGLGAGQFIKTDDTIIADSTSPIVKFQEALEESDFNGKVLITGMSLPHTLLFKGVRTDIPDYNLTQKQRLIVCDKANWYFDRHWDREKPKVKAILKLLLTMATPDKIICFAINREIAEDIRGWDLGIAAEVYPMISYYRSEESTGIYHNQRIIVCIGLPWTPKDSYEGYKHIMKHVFKKGMNEDYLRKLEMSETAKNCIMGRGIDPLGKERSIVFVLGGHKNQLQNMISNKKEIVEVEKQGTIQQIAGLYCGFWEGGKVKLNGKAGLQCPAIDYENYELLPKIVEIIRYMVKKDFPERISTSKLAQDCFTKIEDRDRIVEILQTIFEYLPDIYELEPRASGWSIVRTGK